MVLSNVQAAARWCLVYASNYMAVTGMQAATWYCLICKQLHDGVWCARGLMGVSGVQVAACYFLMCNQLHDGG